MEEHDELADVLETQAAEVAARPKVRVTSEESKEKALDYIKRFIATNGYAPTIRETTEYMGYKSVESVHRIFVALKDEGKITWEPRRGRTLRVL